MRRNGVLSSVSSTASTSCLIFVYCSARWTSMTTPLSECTKSKLRYVVRLMYILECTSVLSPRRMPNSVSRLMRSVNQPLPSMVCPSPPGVSRSGNNSFTTTAYNGCNRFFFHRQRRKTRKNAHFSTQSVTFATEIVSVLYGLHLIAEPCNLAI